MTTIFQKIEKTYFGASLSPWQNGFSWKKGLSVFKYSNYLRSCKKSEKTNKMKNAELTDGRTDRRTNNGGLIGPSVGQGSN